MGPMLVLAAFLATSVQGQTLADDGLNAGSCNKGLCIISVRASNEPPGIGLAGQTVGVEVTKMIPESMIVPLNYPATVVNPYYPNSVTNGTNMLQDLIRRYNESCPTCKIAIIGYSQGAQVTLDALCGSDEDTIESISPIDSSIIKEKVVAVTLFGDPTHNVTAPFNKGTSTKDGLLARTNTNNCLPYTDRIISYCDTQDEFCDSGHVQAVHKVYFTKYNTAAAQFIVQKFEAAIGVANNSSMIHALANATTTTSLAASALLTHNGLRSVIVCSVLSVLVTALF